MNPVMSLATQIAGVAGAELRKLKHDPIELMTRTVQPILWLLLFGGVMAKVRGIAGDGVRYLDFLAPGVLAQSVLFSAIFFGIAAIWERDSGILQRYLVSPAPRIAIVIGKVITASGRGLSQAVVVYLVALVAGASLDFHPLHLLGVAFMVALGAGLFSTFSLVMACTVRTRERMMGAGQLLTMPIFFASNAIYPLALMPAWLQVVSRINPLTYEVDALRGLMLQGAEPVVGYGIDFGVMILALAALMALAARLLQRMA